MLHSPSHWTLEGVAGTKVPRYHGVDAADFDQFVDICAIQFDDDGRFLDASQVETCTDTIHRARGTPNGAVVLAFVHGWKHNADWDDSNFVQFRRLVRAMSLRERERYDGGHRARRVVGVYLGWNGRNEDSWLANLGPLENLTYWDRDAAARQVGEDGDLGRALRSIAEATKSPLERASAESASAGTSPLLFVGHSMGGLILELALTHWARDVDGAMPGAEWSGGTGVAELTRHGVPFAGPDLILLLNPASVASDTLHLAHILNLSGWQKRMLVPGTAYRPPLVISATSTDDSALRALRFVKWEQTAGFTPDVHTHGFMAEPVLAQCAPKGTLGPAPLDFGQFWHCLHRDATYPLEAPTWRVDLPDNPTDRHSHQTYSLTPTGAGVIESPLLWVFQVPDAIIDDHNDVFNPAAASLVLALFQLSGAVVSIDTEWERIFD